MCVLSVNNSPSTATPRQTASPLLLKHTILSMHHRPLYPSPSLMGNAACGAAHATRVVTGDGSVEEHRRAVSAGELMVEHPGHFLCDAANLVVGCRVPGLAADDELRRRRVYFLLPMDMLFSVLTEEEMAAISRRAGGAFAAKKKKKKKKKKNKKRNGMHVGRRIFPVCSSVSVERKQAVKNIGPKKAKAKERGLVRRLSTRRSWKPALDTIDEVNFHELR